MLVDNQNQQYLVRVGNELNSCLTELDFHFRAAKMLFIKLFIFNHHFGVFSVFGTPKPQNPIRLISILIFIGLNVVSLIALTTLSGLAF